MSLGLLFCAAFRHYTFCDYPYYSIIYKLLGGMLLNLHFILSDVLTPCFKSVQRQLEGDNLCYLALQMQISFPIPIYFLYIYIAPLLIHKGSLLTLLRPYASI